MQRRNVGSGSPFEASIGFSRAVRIGSHVAVAGTAPIGPDGKTTSVGDVHGQTLRCLQIIEKALEDAGASLRDAGRAHGEFFGDIRPACTFVEVKGFIDPQWLVELEADAVVA